MQFSISVMPIGGQKTFIKGPLTKGPYPKGPFQKDLQNQRTFKTKGPSKPKDLQNQRTFSKGTLNPKDLWHKGPFAQRTFSKGPSKPKDLCPKGPFAKRLGWDRLG